MEKKWGSNGSEGKNGRKKEKRKETMLNSGVGPMQPWRATIAGACAAHKGVRPKKGWRSHLFINTIINYS